MLFPPFKRWLPPFTCYALWSLTGTSVGLSFLPTYRQTATMPQSALASDIHEPFNVHGYFTTKVTLDDKLFFNDLTQLIDFIFFLIDNTSTKIYTTNINNLSGRGPANAVNVGQTYFYPLFSW